MRAEQKTASLMAGPYAAFLLAFAVYPIAFALVLVFLQWDLVTAPTFAGADNIRLVVPSGGPPSFSRS
jgi:ABC-type sugar transport system permease subunit